MPVKIRKARASDAQGILDILQPYIEEGIVLNRKVSEIRENIPTFFVAESASRLCGVIAYYRYSAQLMEVRSLAVRQTSKKKGIGRMLVIHLMEFLLKESPSAKIFTLTYIPEFFKKFSFRVVSVDTLPEKIWKDCSKCTKAEKCGETALVYTGKR
jgi:amino-acid N-acetyltransferase